MAKAGETGIGVEQTPARWKIRIARFALTETPYPIHESDHGSSHDGNTEEGVREAAMMIEGEGGSAETAENVKVRGLGCERERGRGECRFPI